MNKKWVLIFSFLVLFLVSSIIGNSYEDKEDPTFSEIKVEGKKIEGEIVKISCLWEDNLMIRNVTFEVKKDGNLIEQETKKVNEKRKRVNFDYTLPRGVDKVIWRMIAYDTSGNRATAPDYGYMLLNITTDDEIPVIKKIYQSEDEVRLGEIVELSVYTEDEAALDKATLYIDGEEEETVSLKGKRGAMVIFEYKARFLGLHKWKIEVMDRSGNIKNSINKQLNVVGGPVLCDINLYERPSSWSDCTNETHSRKINKCEGSEWEEVLEIESCSSSNLMTGFNIVTTGMQSVIPWLILLVIITSIGLLTYKRVSERERILKEIQKTKIGKN